MADCDYLLVDFWASWCGPCRKSIPHIREMAEKYADRKLKVVSISIDTKRALWLKALDEEKMAWINLWDNIGISKQFGVTTIPSVFVIECKSGKVLGARMYGDTLTRKIKEIFEK